MKALSLLAKAIHAPFVLPESFVPNSFEEEADVDKALKGVMRPRHERLLQAWGIEKLDN